MIHGMTVPGTIEAAQRAKGYTKGLFEWLRKAPWSNPAFSSIALSIVLFGFLAGLGIGPAIFGAIIDTTGSYDLMWLLSALAAAGAAVVIAAWQHSVRKFVTHA